MSHKKARVPKAYIQSKIFSGISIALEKHRIAAYKRGYEEASNDVKGVCTIHFSEKIHLLRQEKENLNSHVDALNADLTNAEQKQAHFDYETAKLKDEIKILHHKLLLANQQNQIMPFVNNGLVIHNWRDSWKWISSWSFALILFFATTPIPPELLAVLPADIRGYLIAFTAFCGFVGRYANQSKGIQQWLSKS